MGIKTVNWYCNGSYQLHLVKEISPRYDWCLVPEKSRLKDYETMGAHPIYCQEAANPTVYKPYNIPKEFDVTFIGQAYGERPAYLASLVAQGIDVRIWGHGWRTATQSEDVGTFERVLRAGRKLLTPEGRRVIRSNLQRALNVGVHARLPDSILGGLLSDEEMIRMYSRSKINLGFSACGSTHECGERIVQVRLRDFEVPMSGGFYMVEYMEELKEFYDIGKEIVCYADPADLADKITYYLAHDLEREEIRRAGYERCKKHHTWHKRFEMAFREMGLV
jgi:spore maturation protein CgeB